MISWNLPSCRLLDVNQVDVLSFCCRVWSSNRLHRSHKSCCCDTNLHHRDHRQFYSCQCRPQKGLKPSKVNVPDAKKNGFSILPSDKSMLIRHVDIGSCSTSLMHLMHHRFLVPFPADQHYNLLHRNYIFFHHNMP